MGAYTELANVNIKSTALREEALDELVKVALSNKCVLDDKKANKVLDKYYREDAPEETHKYLLIFVLELFDNYDTISEIVIDYSMRVGLGPLSIVVGG